MHLFDLYILFWIYSMMGWCIETIWVSFKNKKFINRGFFLGPYCPIYGTGGILLLSLNNYKNDLLVVFILSVFICSIVEYLTSYFLELIYRVRWWDYSNRFFNINGRICLFNSFFFGLFGLLAVCILNPYFINKLELINSYLKYFILISLFALTTIDIVITFTAMFDFRKYINSLKNKTFTNLFKINADSTEEISKRVKNSLKEKSFIHKHLLKSYSGFKVYKDNLFKKGEELIKYRNYRSIENIFVIGSISSFILGFIIGKILNNIRLCIIISFIINLIIVSLINRSKNGK